MYIYIHNINPDMYIYNMYIIYIYINIIHRYIPVIPMKSHPGCPRCGWSRLGPDGGWAPGGGSQESQRRGEHGGNGREALVKTAAFWTLGTTKWLVYIYIYGYGSISINTIFRGMNIHLPAILMWTTGVQGFVTLPYIYIGNPIKMDD